jgi:hypothetical protein
MAPISNARMKVLFPALALIGNREQSIMHSFEYVSRFLDNNL